MSFPLLSVVIPTYNRAALVREAVLSVFAQTFRNFELIVVDDGSTDETEKTLAGCAEFENPGLRYLRIPHSGMPGLARNRGAAAAGGSYLAFLDSDDLWLPEKLEHQLRLFTAGAPPRLCHTRERWLRRGEEISQAGQRHRREGDIFADALKKCIIGPSTVIIEKNFFDACGGFREDLEIAEDYELWLRMSFSGAVAYLDEALTIKRAMHSQPGAADSPPPAANLSEKYGHIEIFRIRALKSLLDAGAFSSAPDRESLACKELARKCGLYAAGCRKRAKPEEADEYEKLAHRYALISPPLQGP
jgi:glycosyltransferase involved in cell wall biosynthesis